MSRGSGSFLIFSLEGERGAEFYLEVFLHTILCVDGFIRVFLSIF